MVWKPFRKMAALGKRAATATVAAAKRGKTSVQKAKERYLAYRKKSMEVAAEKRYQQKSSHHLGRARNLDELEQQLRAHDQKMRYPDKVSPKQAAFLTAQAKAQSLENLVKEMKKPDSRREDIRSQSKVVASYYEKGKERAEIEKLATRKAATGKKTQEMMDWEWELKVARQKADILKERMKDPKLTPLQKRTLREKWQQTIQEAQDAFKQLNQLREKMA